MGKRLTIGDNDLIKNLNLGIVLDTIRTEGAVSRAGISKLTGLSKSTCSLMVEKLLRSGLIIEKGKDHSSGGRKPVLLQINYEAGRTVGIKFMADRIIAALVDLNGNAVKIIEKPVPFPVDQKEYFASLEDVISNLLDFQQNGVERRKVLGIGIGMSGLVDSEEGVSLQSSILHWDNIPIKRILEARFKIPVYLENDVNTFALGEKWFGFGKEIDNFICVTIGKGIGIGIIIDGKLYRGSHHGAGEFGHMKISSDEDAPLCSCGHRGCIEGFASDPAICRYVEQSITEGKESILKGEKAITISKVLNAARKGDALCLEAFKRAGYYLGYGLSNLINLFDPDTIIIGGEGTAAGEFIFPEMESVIHTTSIYGLDTKVKILPLYYEDNLWVRGVATLVIREIFKIPF